MAEIEEILRGMGDMEIDSMSGIPFKIKKEEKENEPVDESVDTCSEHCEDGGICESEAEGNEENIVELLPNTVFEKADPARKDEYYYFSAFFEAEVDKVKMKKIGFKRYLVTGRKKIKTTYEKFLNANIEKFDKMGFKVLETVNSFATYPSTNDKLHVVFILDKK